MAQLTQVEINGIAQLKTDLANAGAVMIAELEYYTKAGKRIHRVSYSEENGGVVSETKVASIVEIEGSIKFYGSKPVILNTAAPGRSPYIPEATIRTGFSNRFPDEDIITVDINILEDEDLVYIESNNTVEDTIKERMIKVWMDNGTPKWQVK